jgi:hypothetical protein
MATNSCFLPGARLAESGTTVIALEVRETVALAVSALVVAMMATLCPSAMVGGAT